MSLQTWLFILFLTSFSVTSNTALAMEVSYRQHCNSTVPEYISIRQELNPENFIGFRNGYYKGGESILGQDRKSYGSRKLRKVSFITKALYRTEQPGLFKVEGILQFRGGTLDYSRSLRVELHGFWSESSGKLCMVGSGSGSGYFNGGKLLDLSTVLNLNYPKVSTIGTSLVTGSLKSLESEDKESYFDPISILSFFSKTYRYSMLSEAKTTCSVFSTKPDNYFLKIGKTICDMINFYYRQFRLEYPVFCRIKNCNPFDSPGFLPGIMFIHEIQCSAGGKLHIVLGFSTQSGFGNYHELVPEATLIGEGMWDEEKNLLCIVGCHLLSLRNSLENTTVGDCSIGLSLRFHEVLSLRNRNSVVGQIWSNKNQNESGYFERFLLRSSVDQTVLDTPSLKYSFTEMDFANKHCGSSFLGWKKVIERKMSWGRRYPDGFSSVDMNFNMYVKNSLGETTPGRSVLLTSESFYPRTQSLSSYEQESNQNLFNVSYIIRINPSFNFKWGDLPTANSLSDKLLEISAEGIYDADNGILCMVGCQYKNSFNESLQDSMDCELLINIQFPLQPKQFDSEHIRGTITSTRMKSDPFYMEDLKFSSSWDMDSIWEVELDMNMVLIFFTLASAVIGLQIYYVKNNPDGFLSVSLPMLVLLVMSHTIPLLIYFEAFFLDRTWFQYAVVLRIVTVVGFLLQIRLLRLIWPARSVAERRKGLWALYLCLPIYFVETMIASYMH